MAQVIAVREGNGLGHMEFAAIRKQQVFEPIFWAGSSVHNRERFSCPLMGVLMEKFEAHRVAGDSSGRIGNARSRRFAATVWAGFCLPERSRRLWVAAAAIFASGLIAEPASAQDSGANGWIIQGGPYIGAAFSARGISPEFRFRFGGRRETQVLDLNVSTFPVQYYVPQVRRWSFEALAGLAWQPSLLGIGFRSGLYVVPNALGERLSGLVLGPHTALAVPLSPLFELRGEAGINFYDVLTWGLAGPRGYLQVGIEGRRR